MKKWMQAFVFIPLTFSPKKINKIQCIHFPTQITQLVNRHPACSLISAYTPVFYEGFRGLSGSIETRQFRYNDMGENAKCHM